MKENKGDKEVITRRDGEGGQKNNNRMERCGKKGVVKKMVETGWGLRER